MYEEYGMENGSIALTYIFFTLKGRLKVLYHKNQLKGIPMPNILIIQTPFLTGFTMNTFISD